MPFSGGDAAAEKDMPPGIVSLHQVFPDGSDGGRLAMPLTHPGTSRTLYVRKIPVLSSREFKKVSFEDGAMDDTQVLVAELDRRGRMRWMQTCVELSNTYIAVLVDSKYQFMWRIPRPAEADEENLRIHGPWDAELTDAIRARAAENYRRLNKN